ncbi:hypothetical protein GDO81_025694, partial [Engystomops pustulosus]
FSQFQEEYSLEQVQGSRKVFDYLTVLQCCPTSDGAAAAILASEDFVKRHGLQPQAVEIVAQEMVTDTSSTFDEESCIKAVGFDMSRMAAERCYHKAGVRPQDVDVIELHDCFSANELITYEALGLCPLGKDVLCVQGSQCLIYGVRAVGRTLYELLVFHAMRLL